MKAVLAGVADENYLPRYVVAFDSFLKKLEGDPPALRLMADNVAESTKTSITEFFACEYPTVDFAFIEQSLAQRMREARYPTYSPMRSISWISATTLKKAFVVETLSADFDRIIHIDADVLFTRSAHGLLQIEVNQLAAVPAVPTWFNAGVIIFNSSAIPKDLWIKWDMALIAAGGWVGDETIWNQLFHGTFEPLDQIYNVRERNALLGVMYHYNGQYKPWDSTNADSRCVWYRSFVSFRKKTYAKYNIPLISKD